MKIFYYPELSFHDDLVSVQVVLPGGWHQDLGLDRGLSFWLESLLFTPTKRYLDVDLDLWEMTEDYWSITSYESIRLSFIFDQKNCSKVLPLIRDLFRPRLFETTFAERELEDLQTFWQVDRDRQEDQVLRELFQPRPIVHLEPRVIDNLQISDLGQVYERWRELPEPQMIVCGKLDYQELDRIGSLETYALKLKDERLEPKKWRVFRSQNRLGLWTRVPTSSLQELLLIELWDQVFGVKFFFEYHGEDLYVWTEAVEDAETLLLQIKSYSLQKADFEKAKWHYRQFLDEVYEAEAGEMLEKKVELVEGLHAHDFQKGTYEVCSGADLDIRHWLNQLAFADFKEWYQSFEW